MWTKIKAIWTKIKKIWAKVFKHAEHINETIDIIDEITGELNEDE